MRRSAFIAALAGVLLGRPGAALAVTITFQREPREVPLWRQGLDVTLDSRAYYKGFSGDRRRATGGRLDQFLTQDDLVAKYQRSLSNGLELKGDLSVRNTNDRSLAANKDLILQNVFLSVEKKDRAALRFGNILPNFSKYTLGTTLPGIEGYLQRGAVRLSGVAARLEEDDGRRYRRWTGGGRLEARELAGASLGPLAAVAKKLSAGASLVSTNDEGDSISNTHNVPKLDAVVAGGDVKIELRGNLTAKFDIAGSNQRDNAGAHRLGRAVLFDLDWNPGRVTSGIALEEQSPDFRSPAGSASPDLRRMGSRLGCRFADWAAWDNTADLTRNNLRGQLGNTTIAETYRSGLNVKPWGWIKEGALKTLTADLSVRFNRQTTSNHSAYRETANYDVSVKHSFRRLDYGLGYSNQRSRDLVNGRNNRAAHNPKFNLGFRWDIAPRIKFTLNPAYNWSWSRDYGPAGGDKTEILTQDLRLDGTIDGGRFSAGFGTTSSQRPPPAGASYLRRFKLDWSQSLLEGLTLTASYSHNYATETDGTRNYDENQWNLGLKYQF